MNLKRGEVKLFAESYKIWVTSFLDGVPHFSHSTKIQSFSPTLQKLDHLKYNLQMFPDYKLLDSDAYCISDFVSQPFKGEVLLYLANTDLGPAGKRNLLFEREKDHRVEEV